MCYDDEGEGSLLDSKRGGATSQLVNEAGGGRRKQESIVRGGESEPRPSYRPVAVAVAAGGSASCFHHAIARNSSCELELG